MACTLYLQLFIKRLKSCSFLCVWLQIKSNINREIELTLVAESMKVWATSLLCTLLCTSATCLEQLLEGQEYADYAVYPNHTMLEGPPPA